MLSSSCHICSCVFGTACVEHIRMFSVCHTVGLTRWVGPAVLYCRYAYQLSGGCRRRTREFKYTVFLLECSTPSCFVWQGVSRSVLALHFVTSVTRWSRRRSRPIPGRSSKHIFIPETFYVLCSIGSNTVFFFDSPQFVTVHITRAIYFDKFAVHLPRWYSFHWFCRPVQSRL